MPSCSHCGQQIDCPGHAPVVGAPTTSCPLKKGALWVQVIDDRGAGVQGVPVTVLNTTTGQNLGARDTDEDGLVAFDPLDAAEFTASMSTTLPERSRATHKPPEKPDHAATVVQGQIAFVRFKLLRKQPKIEVIDNHAFLELFAGLTATQKITVKNVGDADLVIKTVTFPAVFPEGAGNLLKDGAIVKPGEELELETSFAPTTPGDHGGDLSIACNDPDFATKIVKLTGKATRKLKLVSVDDHFAPSVEDLDIQYDLAGFIDADSIELRILDKTGKIIHRRALKNGAEKATGAHPLPWDGRLADGTFIDPQSSPFKAVLTDGALLTDEKPFHVAYHSLRLAPGEWLPREQLDELDAHIGPQAPDFTGAGASFCDEKKTILWTWYQLASQGFYPGPLVDARAPDDALGKAIRRFRQGVPALYKPVFKIENGDYKPEPAKLAEAAKIDGPLLKELASGAHKRLGAGAAAEKAVLSDDSVLTPAGAGKTARLFADVDRFYYFDEFLNRRKNDVDKEWVLPPLLCVKATVTLRDKRGDAVEARHPSAIGPVQVAWTWTDRAQDTSALPGHTAGKPSRVKEYLDKAVAPLSSYHYKNTRSSAGGIVDGANRAVDDNVVFLDHELYGSGLAGGLRWTGPVKDPAKYASAGGSTMVFFRPSTIGGDNYKISAKLDVGGATLEAVTGELEVWRRVTIGAYLKWGAVSKPGADKWDRLRGHFRHAFIEVVGPLRDLDVATLPATPKHLLEAAIDGAYSKPKSECTSHYDRNETLLKFSADYLFPDDPRSVELVDTPLAELAAPAQIVNALLIGPLAALLRQERDLKETTTFTGRNAHWPPPLLSRKNIAALWQGSATPWIKAVGDHFQPIFAALEATYPTRPAGRKVARIAAATLAGCPANRSAILDALFHDIVAPAVTEWTSRAPLSPPNLARMKTLAIFLAQITKESVQTTVHPIVLQAVGFYKGLISDDAYIGKTAGLGPAMTYVARDVDIDLRCAGKAEANAALVAYGGPTFTAKAHPTTHKVSLTFSDPGAVAGYDYGALRATARGADHLGVMVLRGPSADPMPRFVVDDLTDARLDAFGREQLLQAEKNLALVRVATRIQPPLGALGEVLDAVVRHPDITPTPVVGGALVICNYATHRHPIPIEVGIPGLDIADFSNPQNIAKDGGLVLVANETDMERGHLYAHEMAHCLFLTHWQQFNENIHEGFSSRDDHDLADHNCIMSYSKYDGSFAASHFGKTTYEPEFCGKCNLKLRGWDIAGLPASSREHEPIFPLAAANSPTTTICPDLAPMHAQLMTLMTELGTPKAAIVADPSFPAGNTWIQLYAAAATRVTAGTTEYTRTAVALTQKPSNAVIPASVAEWVHQAGQAKPDATLLIEENDTAHSAWEELLDWVYAKGGTTNSPTIIFNAASRRFFDAGTAFHEFIHFYQNYDTALITEGFVDVAAAMLAARFEAASPAGIPFEYNQSYLQSTQFMVDEIIPRLGLLGAARMFFVTGKDGLQQIFRAGAMAKDFDEALKQGPHGEGPHTYEPLRQLLVPLDMCPTPPALSMTLQADYAAAITLLHQQLDAIATSIGQPQPSTLATPAAQKLGREKVASMARIKFKFEVWKEQRDEAQRFRSETAAMPENGKHRQVHRSAPYIEEKMQEMQQLNRLYMACGGANLIT